MKINIIRNWLLKHSQIDFMAGSHGEQTIIQLELTKLVFTILDTLTYSFNYRFNSIQFIWYESFLMILKEKKNRTFSMFSTFCSQWDNWNELMQYSPRWICIWSRNSRINITLVQMNNSTEEPKQTTKPKCYCMCFFYSVLKMALLPICWINSIQFTWMLNSRWEKKFNKLIGFENNDEQMVSSLLFSR